jgi:predicted SnoaL-like aldol condensation-catalyzing enzyme
VMAHGRYTRPDGPNWIVVDVMRMKDGIFEEHWDVIQDEATKEQSKSGLPMFGDRFPK